jgi:hypothetical protein
MNAESLEPVLHQCPLCGEPTFGAFSDLLPNHRLAICATCQEAENPTERLATWVRREPRRRPA